MSIAEKLTTIAENVPKVYEAGVEEGKRNFGVLEIVTGTGFVNCNYVNSFEKNMLVRLSSDTITDFSGVEIKCVGKNLFDKINPPERIQAYIYYVNGVYNWQGSSDSYSYRISCKPNTTYTISVSNPQNALFRAGYSEVEEIPEKNGDKVTIYGVTLYANSEKPIYVKTSAEAKYIVIQLGASQYETDFETLQIEIGSIATTYEPYSCTTYTVSTDGTIEIPRLSPVANLSTDTEEVDIEASYYLDAKEKIGSLTM